MNPLHPYDSIAVEQMRADLMKKQFEIKIEQEASRVQQRLAEASAGKATICSFNVEQIANGFLLNAFGEAFYCEDLVEVGKRVTAVFVRREIQKEGDGNAKRADCTACSA